MTTVHRWFQSGKYSLLGHVDLPEMRGPIGVVMAPPFGWEDESSYRPLRFLARTLAENGIPVLRFDLPGTGDSSGGAADSGLMDAWIQSVEDAASELRAVAGVERVSVIGVRLGATLAAAAARRGSQVQDLVLWGAASSGHSVLRELRAYASLERRQSATGSPPTQPFPGLEVGGFLIAPETVRDLEALDLAASSGAGGRRVLILSRDGLRPDAKLVRAFESSGCAVRLETGEGYSAMMTLPHEALYPTATAQTIVDFFSGGERHRTAGLQHDSAAATIEGYGAAIVESVHTIRSSHASIFGILCEPAPNAPRAGCCVLFLNAGAVRHAGPNRMWVEAARRQAVRGVASLRFDLQGIGESDGDEHLDIPSLYQDKLVEQVELAMDSLRSRLGSQRFILIGLCAGAFLAFHEAIRNRDVRAAILLNPSLFFWDPEVDRRRAVRRGARGLTSPTDWRRAIRGGVQFQNVRRAVRTALTKSQAGLAGAFSRRQIPAKEMAEAWKKIERNGTRLTLVFAGDEPLLREMEEEGQMPPRANPRVRLIRVANAGHTFRPQWAQKMVHDLIDGELESVVSEKFELRPPCPNLPGQ